MTRPNEWKIEPLDSLHCYEDECWHMFKDGEEIYVKTYAFAGGEVWYGVYCKKHAPEDASVYIAKIVPNRKTD